MTARYSYAYGRTLDARFIIVYRFLMRCTADAWVAQAPKLRTRLLSQSREWQAIRRRIAQGTWKNDTMRIAA